MGALGQAASPAAPERRYALRARLHPSSFRDAVLRRVRRTVRDFTAAGTSTTRRGYFPLAPIQGTVRHGCASGDGSGLQKRR
jgi:hypothetical protein